jgi:hypothetical protein
MIAYVDPSAGLALLPALLALLAVAGSAAVAVLLWPVTTLLRMIRGRKQAPADTSAAPPSDALPGTVNGNGEAGAVPSTSIREGVS